MKRIMRYGALFVLVMTVSVLSHAPAAFVLRHLPKVAGLEISGVSGTIWHGQAQQVHWRGNGLGQVNWHFVPQQLLSARLEYALRFGQGSDLQLRGKGNVGVSLSGLYAENLHATLPAVTLLHYSPYPIPAEVRGQLDLTLRSYHYAAPWCAEAEGTLMWHDSRVNSAFGTLQLGSVLAELSCQNNQLMAQSSHSAAQVSGALIAELNAKQQYKLDAWFKPGAEFPPGMQAQLKWLGNPDQQGRYPFILSGKL